MATARVTMVERDTLKLCPGCPTQIGRTKFACRPCWLRLPLTHRQAITAAYRAIGTAGGLARYGAAALAARRWIEDQ